MTRFGGAEELRLGRGSGPSFQAWESRPDILVGSVACPVISPRRPVPCSGCSSKNPAVESTRVEPSVGLEVDLSCMQPCSPSPVTCPASDPMLAEAALCTPRAPVAM
jgi:hypothetical protein